MQQQQPQTNLKRSFSKWRQKCKTCYSPKNHHPHVTETCTPTRPLLSWRCLIFHFPRTRLSLSLISLLQSIWKTMPRSLIWCHWLNSTQAWIWSPRTKRITRGNWRWASTMCTRVAWCVKLAGKRHLMLLSWPLASTKTPMCLMSRI